MSSDLKKVDVVIPVYNAADATRRCIESIYKHVGHKISGVYIHDDKSDEETANMLDEFDFPNLHVHHAEKNSGYGGAVNQAIARSKSDYVMMVSSDTVAEDDFLTPLIEALDEIPDLAALNACGEVFARKHLDSYDQSAGYVKSYSLSGYAFLVRREAYEQINGFDPYYGRGYFEDADIARRFINNGWRLGMHPKTFLKHEHQGSFKSIKGVNELYEGNKVKYFERYPEATKSIMLFSTNTAWVDMPADMLEKVEVKLNAGAKVYWISKNPNQTQPCIDVKIFNKGMRRIVRLMNMRKRDRFKGVDEVWFAPDTGKLKLKIYRWFAQRRGITVKEF
jgi:GT2 family glycosyltransferase